MRETVEGRGRANDYEGRDGLGTASLPVKTLYEGGPLSFGGETTRSRASRTERTVGGLSRRPLGRTYWLISKNTPGRMEVLTLGPDGGGTLPVFSHEEKAEMSLGFGDAGDGWRVRKSSAGEVLYGPCAGAKEVALDPLPEMVSERTVGLVSLPRERFIERIEDGERFFGSRKLARRY